MNQIARIVIIVLFLSLLLTACSTAQSPVITYDPSSLIFSGDTAYALEEEFVTTFIDRHSGTEQSRLATEWLKQQFEDIGLTIL